MKRNRVQFQQGLSPGKFLQRYGSEGPCEQAVFKARWPDGLRCPECGSRRHCRIRSRKLWQCHACHRQSSLVAGTIFAATKPAADHLVPGDPPADAGQARRFVAAVQVTAAGQPARMRLSSVAGLRKKTLAAWAGRHLQLGTEVHSDGPACFRGVADAGCEHVPTVTGGGQRSCGDSRFVRVNVRVNTMLANVKQSLAGACHSLDGKHLPRYLAEFRYRFNRRYDLEVLVPRLLHASVRTPPMPYRLLTLAESCG